MMPPDTLPKLGILAGGGELPRVLIAACRAQGRDVFVVALKSQCDPQTTQGVDHAWVRMGAAGKAIDTLKANNVVELVMAGRIRKPSMAQLMPDARAMKFMASGVLNKGDDTLLSALVEDLETREGFRVVGVHDVMPELLAPEGVLGAYAPSDEDQPSIREAVHAARDLGAQDIGQAAVAKGEHIIALEDRSGTDAMLESLKGHADAQGAVLAKMMKPGQEKRADLPTIGVATIEHAHAAGLKGVVVHAGGSLIIDRAAVVEMADRLRLFVVGVAP